MKLFVLLVLLDHAAVATEVAGCLSDRDKDHRQRENCTAAGYSDVPSGLSLSTKVLLFPRNLFSRLSWASFQIFPELYEMDLSNNKVPEVSPSVSPILPSLSVLRLGSNRLSSLPDGSFSACPGLTELYLDNNTIESLSDHTFSGLSVLEILDLSSNHIKVLPELMLRPLAAIETLFLENNQISVMPDDWFSPKEEVPYLYLSANPWACSCSLGYLRRYLDDYELNVYVRDGPLIKGDAESVVCDSPQIHKGRSVMSLEESDLCSRPTESASRGDFIQPIRRGKTTTTTASTTTASTTTASTTTASTTTATTTTASTTTASTTTASTSTTSTTATSTSTAPSSAGTPAFLHTENHGGSSLVESRSTIKLSTERPASITSAMTTKATTTTKSVPSTSTPKVQVVMTTTVIPPWANDDQRRGEISAVGGAGVFCLWLFAGCLLLCVASAVCISATVATMVMWYRRGYRRLKMQLVRNRGGAEGGRSRGEEKEVVGGVVALYRSVLFIHRDGEERMDVAARREGGGGREERGAYSQTLYRVVSREEEIEGWRDVLEECRRDGGRNDEGMDGERRGGASRKRYSVILREEREEAGGGREELDWVVGGWEVKRGGEREEPRSSWGEWLAHYLPSMPWGVTTPPEGEAVH